jgi:hypothetical protein
MKIRGIRNYRLRKKVMMKLLSNRNYQPYNVVADAIRIVGYINTGSYEHNYP